MGTCPCCSSIRCRGGTIAITMAIAAHAVVFSPPSSMRRFHQGLGGRCSNLSKQKGGRRDPRSGPCSAPLPISRWSPHEVTCTCRFSPAAFGCRACYSSRRLWGHAPRARISQDEKEMVHVVMSKMIEMIMTCQRTMTVINPAIGIWIPIPILFRHRKKNRSCSYSHMGMDQYL